MKKDVVSVGIALVLTLVVFAGFASAVMAFNETDRSYGYSSDVTAYALVEVSYSLSPPTWVYVDQYLQGNITEGNVQRAATTLFEVCNDNGGVVYEVVYLLQNNTGVEKLWYYSGVYFVMAQTDSGYGWIPQSTIYVQIGPPGTQ
jgi:phage tail sheath protein FI